MKASPPLVTANIAKAVNYMPKSWIKDTLLESED
jgi:hypothetical protein